jgi:transposase
MEVIMTVKEYHSVQELLSLAKSEPNPRLARRIQVVALAQQEHSCPEIIQMTGNCRRAIQMWVAKYNAHNIEGLKEQPRSGRCPKLPATKHRKFCSRIDAGAAKKDSTATLSGKDIQQILKENFGVVYTLDGVYKLLHRLGYSCLKPRPRHEKADPLVQEEFKKTFPRSWMKSNQSSRVKK